MLALALSNQDLLDIVAAASTIDERLAKGFLPEYARTNAQIVTARLEAWCQAIAKGDWEQFRQRLAWDDLDEERVRPVLGAVRQPERLPLPCWTETLSEVLELAMSLPVDEAGASQADEGRLSFLSAKEPFPFEEVLVPFVLLARQRCMERAADGSALLSDQAHAALQRSLLQTLTAYAAQALYLEFAIACAQAQSPLERLLTIARPCHDERTHYRQFIKRMRQRGLVRFFREYAVLARLLATITELWIEATVEFLQRLAADWPDIQQMFGGESELGRVTKVQPSLSDPHRGRRSVIALIFASGCKVVYKPKDLGTEEAYYRLLAWCNEHGAPLPFKVLTVLNRSSHGWVKFVEHEACKDRAEGQRYYRRAGMLLCLIYALEGTDCHCENVIAGGEHPVLVDTETLLHHRPHLEALGETVHAQVLANEHLAHSVTRTGLLPSWLVRNDVRGAFDISGLGGVGKQELLVRAPRWERVNTDYVRLAYGPLKMRAKENEPLLDGMLLCLEKHSEDLITGFQQMYRFLLEQREALLAPWSPLHAFAQQQVRFDYRYTWVYGWLEQKLLAPRYLRDGADRSIQLELLGRAVLPLEGPLRDRKEQSRCWPLFAAERVAMEQADIPFFTAHADSDALVVAPGQQIQACFQGPSFDLVVARLKALSDEDLQQQVSFISASLYAYAARLTPGISAVNSIEIEVNANADATGLPTREELLAQAVSIAEQIAMRAIRAEDGSMAWIAPRYLLRAERYQLQPLGYDLYDGTCGIGLFLAALEQVTGGAGYRELALGAVQPLLQALRDYAGRTTRDMGIGGATGLGSVVYALVRMSQWLHEELLLENARRAARLITAERIAEDRALNIFEGAAGAMLGLLALYDVSPDQTILDKAMACGQHLLQTGAMSPRALWAWPRYEGTKPFGFAHGAAGIAYALLRLYALTQHAGLLAAAKEGIIYEESLFTPGGDNWSDLRVEEQPAWRMSWCQGMPGIALARIGGLPVLDTPRIRKEIEFTVQAIQKFGVQSQDHLCCGNLGRGDILLVATRWLSRPELARAGLRGAGQVVTKAVQTGAFALHPQLPKQVYCPGFFQGMAGIGYALLRLAQPEALPCVLLWE